MGNTSLCSGQRRTDLQYGSRGLFPMEAQGFQSTWFNYHRFPLPPQFDFHANTMAIFLFKITRFEDIYFI